MLMLSGIRVPGVIQLLLLISLDGIVRYILNVLSNIGNEEKRN